MKPKSIAFFTLWYLMFDNSNFHSQYVKQHSNVSLAKNEYTTSIKYYKISHNSVEKILMTLNLDFLNSWLIKLAVSYLLRILFQTSIQNKGGGPYFLLKSPQKCFASWLIMYGVLEILCNVYALWWTFSFHFKSYKCYLSIKVHISFFIRRFNLQGKYGKQ